MTAFAEMRALDLWYARLDIEDARHALGRAAGRAKQLKRFERNVAKARTKDSLRASDKLTHVVDGKAADHQRPAADRPDRGALSAQDRDRGSRHTSAP